MSNRATVFGTGTSGGTIEYRGDLPEPVTTYASALPETPLATRLSVPASRVTQKSAVVNRMPRRGGIRCFYIYGGVRQPEALPHPGAGAVGNVESSMFQKVLVWLSDFHINPSWYEAGYPRNLGLSTRVPQLETNVTGGPGRSSMDQRPLFTRVQTVPRTQAMVRRYPTKGARG